MERPKVKLDDIIEGIEMASGEATSYLDLHTGRVEYIGDETHWAMSSDSDPAALPEWQRPIVEMARQIEADENKERFLPLPNQFDANEWEMMAEFAESAEDSNVGYQLSNACRGGGAFRRFKDAVHRLGVEKQWYEFRDARYRELAIEWCEANEITWQ